MEQHRGALYRSCQVSPETPLRRRPLTAVLPQPVSAASRAAPVQMRRGGLARGVVDAAVPRLCGASRGSARPSDGRGRGGRVPPGSPASRGGGGELLHCLLLRRWDVR